MVVVPLTEQALHLINKYRGVDTKGRLFPFISKQKYNEAIKEVLSRVGIERIVQVRNPLTGEMERVNIADKITSHIARKTFTAAAYREVKDPNIVCKMTGHIEGSKAFTRYNNIEDEVLASVVKSESFLGKIDTAKAEVIKMVESLNDEQLEKVKAYINTLL
jgi:integrase